MVRFIVAFSLFFILCAASLAQSNNPAAEYGFKPYGSFNAGNIDSINLLNENLNLRIPLVSVPQRGGKLNLGFSVVYIAPTLSYVLDGPTCTSDPRTCNQDWSLTNAGGLTGAGIAIAPDDFPGLPLVNSDNSITFTTSDGAIHKVFSGTNANDGTGYFVTGTRSSGCVISGITFYDEIVVITDPSGVRYNWRAPYPGGPVCAGPLVSVEDTNGNKITPNFTSGLQSSFTDTLGRTVGWPNFWNISQTSDLTNCTGSLPMSPTAYIVNVPGVNGATETYKMCVGIVSINLPNCQNASGNTTSRCIFEPDGNRVQSIVLPNRTAWTFGYDSWNGNSTSYSYGDLTQITFPTGGTISYTWASTSQIVSPCAAGPFFWARGVQSRTINANDGQGPHTTTYSLSLGSGTFPTITNTVFDAIGDESVHTFTGTFPNAFGTTGCSYYETQAQFYQLQNGSQALLKTVSTQYNASAYPPLPSIITTTWPTGQVSQITKSYDTAAFGNVTALGEYDYGSGAPGALLLQTLTTYQYQNSGAYKTNNLITLPASITIKDGSGNQKAQTTFGYDEYSLTSSGITTQHDSAPPAGSARGNQTSVHRWLNTTNTFLTSTSPYYDTGTIFDVSDPLGNTTLYAYSSTFVGAYPTTITNPLSQTTTNSYDFNTGLLTSTMDPNRQTTTYNYDSMGRVTSIGYPDLGSTTYCYTDEGGSGCGQSGPPYEVVTTKAVTASLNEISTAIFDGLGRTSQTQLNSDPDGIDYTLTTYDALGRQYQVYNPTRCNPPTSNCGETTWGYTTYAYDALNRTTSVTQPDNSLVLASYSGNCKTVTDEAGKVRKHCSDGLGRMTGVWEDPNNLNYETDYQYDALNDLTLVTQGSETRSFSYDSLARLLSSANPESGGIAYSYDSNGNLLSKTDARGISTTYSYDGLNRLTQKLYSDGTSRAGYVYDQSSVWGNSLSNTIGRLSQQSVGIAQRIFSYDPMGRLANQWECLPSNCGQSSYNTSMLYDLAGDMTQLTYPSSRVVTNTYGGAQRVTQVALTKANGQTLNYLYANGLKYSPNGALHVSAIGNNSSTALTETYGYNNRLQLASESIVSPDVNVMNHSYPFAAGQNNGNVPSIVDQLTSSKTQTFGYDSLNRLSSAVETAWGLGFVYDRYGNLLQQNVTLGSAPSFSAAANTKNQLVGYGYDLSGNMTSDGTHTYQYDAESRLKTLDGGSAAYVYDTQGARIIKTWADTAEYIVANGQTLSQHHSSNWSDWSDLVYLNGRLLAKADSYEDRILITGSNPGSGYSVFAFPSAGGYSGYVMRSGDKLFLRQYQSTGSRGGMQIAFTDGTNTNWNATDSDGQEINNDAIQQSWHYRRIDLSAFAGKTINAIYLDQEVSTTASPWSIYYTDIALVSADGTVRPLYNRETSISLSHSGTSTGTASVNHASNVSQIPDETTTFYHGDHLGSSREMSSVNGYPVWQATYLPFGYEYNPQSTVNNYKFTGKERDNESALDNFDKRYNSSSTDRWTSPDAVNVTDDRVLNPTNTLNKYIYGGNNPLKYIDPDGRDITVFYDPGLPAGHIVLLAYNQSTGEAAVQSFGPVHADSFQESVIERSMEAFGVPVGGDNTYALKDVTSADQLRQQYASYTIQTSPEETQGAIEFIKTHSNDTYTTYWNNCTTTCTRILREIGINVGHPLKPSTLFDRLRFPNGVPMTRGITQGIKRGRDYGNPRPPYDPFQILFTTIHCWRITVTISSGGQSTIDTHLECD